MCGLQESDGTVFINPARYIQITTGEFPTAKSSRTVLNNNYYGAVTTKLFYSILFHVP